MKRTLIVALFVGFGGGLAPDLLASSTAVVTYHNSLDRAGVNPTETQLTPANVSPATFGLLATISLDGDVHAQPLYAPGVTIGGVSRNLMLAATAHGSIFAYDINQDPSVAPLLMWQTSFIAPDQGVYPVVANDIVGGGYTDEESIVGTPVIDTATNVLYVVAKTKRVRGGVPDYSQSLHALSLIDGSEQFGGPTTILAEVPGNGVGASDGFVPFDALTAHQRSGLVLQNGVLVLTWASFTSHPPYHGWLMTYDAKTLKQLGVYNTTPASQEGGIWMSGAAPAIDQAGHVYFATGNGTYTPDGSNLGDSTIRLNSVLDPEVTDYFTPYNQSNLDNSDLDLGSGGITILPDNTSSHPHVLVNGGKFGILYVIDRDNMSHFHADVDQTVQAIPAALNGGLEGAAAFFNNTLYAKGATDTLKAFTYQNGLLSVTPSDQIPDIWEGTTPSISANGTANGIVWIVQTANVPMGHRAVLHAYAANDLKTPIYASTAADRRDAMNQVHRFSTFSIADGRVFVPTLGGGIAVYGPFPAANGLPAAPSGIAAAASVNGAIRVTWTAQSSNLTGYSIDRSLDGTTFQTVGQVSRFQNTYDDTGLDSTKHYFYRLTAQNQLGSSAPSEVVNAVPAMDPTALEITSITANSASLSWTSVADDHYNLERAPSGGAFAVIATLPITTLTYADVNLAPGQYDYRITAFNKAGDSSASHTLGAAIGPIELNYSAGLNDPSPFVTQGSALVTEGLARLTDGQTGEVGTLFSRIRVGIDKFKTTFKFRVHDGTGVRADGFTFLLQPGSVHAIGGGGGGLGASGLANSAVVKFDIYNSSGEGNSSTGLFLNGHVATVPVAGSADINVDLDTTQIDLGNQHPKVCTLSYDGTTLTQVITDQYSGATTTQSYTVNLPQVVGDHSAYIGFSAATGGLAAYMEILEWDYSTTP